MILLVPEQDSRYAVLNASSANDKNLPLCNLVTSYAFVYRGQNLWAVNYHITNLKSA